MNEEINRILSQETLGENEINFLMENIAFLPETALYRLGLKTAIETVATPVLEAISEPTEAIEVPKKRGRFSKKV